MSVNQRQVSASRCLSVVPLDYLGCRRSATRGIGSVTAPRVANGKIDAASNGDRYCAVVRAFLPPAEVPLEVVDPGALRCGFVLEHAPPVVALYSHLLEPQHVFPMKPAIRSPDQGAKIAFPVSEIGARVQEPCSPSEHDVGVPDQCLAILRGRRECELTGFAGGKQPLTVGGPERLLPSERVVEGTEFIQPAFRISDELHAQPVLRFSAPDLVTAILAEFFGDHVFPAGKIADHREDWRI